MTTTTKPIISFHIRSRSVGRRASINRKFMSKMSLLLIVFSYSFNNIMMKDEVKRRL